MSVSLPARPVALPPEVVGVLRGIRTDLQDIPRGCIHDPVQLLLWLRSVANRVEAVEGVQLLVVDAGRLAGDGAAAMRREPSRVVRNRKGGAVKVERKIGVLRPSTASLRLQVLDRDSADMSDGAVRGAA